ncbi:cleavage and polyadenylation specificity factor subunit 1-like isoform X2 [Anneissia japonica]|uniref:cleavage and polyadenylation specificity factor subunit 1-like isoform X2 n=1 Tax=Anneissia japonica TaxID=1529436 RepID=UPI0014255B1D|nr:cleavage and polyadenylation specificity factor subunit 1-like isoform X2 [Anneissia japonica]
MYAMYKQTHPPTGIEHCIYCNFYNRDEENLLIADTNQLHVYRLSKDTQENEVSKNVETAAESKPRKDRIEHLQTFPMFGSIMSIKSVQLSGSSRDSVLISFSEAKLSLLEYDPGTHDLKTLSMHYFEENDLKEGYCSRSTIPEVCVDPENRCAAMLIYSSKLVIVPFRKEGMIDDADFITESRSAVQPTYMIDLSQLDEKILHVIDIQFLHGYYEPTLLVLHEPLRTCPGRIAVRNDTCGIVALSLNIAERVHPVIWAQSNLPFDCIQIQAVPKPIGGVLILAVNSLLYLNQSVPPFGVSLNSLTDKSTSFPLKRQEGVKLTLDCCQVTFISFDKLVLSLKGGEIYVLTLMIDGMRSVRGFHFDRAAASVLTTCICKMEEGYLFLGSRLGNSLLLKYTEKAQTEDNVKKEKKDGEPPTKKVRGEDASDWIASDVSLLEDPDELEVYGKQAQKTGTQVKSYTFEVSDSLLNIGPCGCMVMGEPAFLSEEFQNNPDPDIELVICSGYGKNGALSVLRRTIRPQVVTTFELPGCLDMWTVIGRKEPIKANEEEGSESQSGSKTQTESEISHSFLILSRLDSTMILQTGQEITELDQSGFSTQGPTVYAGNLGNNRYILQVSQMGVRLLEGANQLQHIPLDVGSPIMLCSVADPFIVIMSESGHIILLSLKEDPHGTGHRLSILKPEIPQTSKILALSAYVNEGGMFTTKCNVKKGVVKKNERKKSDTVISEARPTVDEEDELLYGDSEPTIFKPAELTETMETSKPADEVQEEVVDLSYWCLVCRENGLLEIYSLPDFVCMFVARNFPMAGKVLVDSPMVTTSEQAQQQHDMLPVVKEIMITGLGKGNSRPYLFAIVDDDLIIYEAFSYQAHSDQERLQIRFKKLPHSMMMKEKKSKKRGQKAQDEEEAVQHRKTNRLRTFAGVSSSFYSGVFICGPYPHWLFVTARGSLRMHPMPVDGAVTCFAAFNNVNCPNGFLYFNKQGDLRICVLPSHLSYDAPWPVRKVPLRCTPNFVAYHLESKTYAVVTSTIETTIKMVVINNDEREISIPDRDDRFIFPTRDSFSIQLFSPLSWEPIPNTKIEMEEFEHITCLKAVSLNCEGTVSGKKDYIVMTTTYVYNEDIQCRGRIFILDIIEVVPEPGQPLTKNKMKTLYDKEQKGPVSCICDVCGFLLSCIGQKIYLWTFKDNDLIGLAFIDTQVYIHRALSIKNFVIVTDITKSLFLLQYQEEDRTLALVSRDTRPLRIYAAQFMIDDRQLAFLVSDAEKNLIIYHYQPEAPESYGGTRLLRRADINIGGQVNTFVRVSCKRHDPASDKLIAGPSERRQITYFATLDGAMGFLMPVSEKTYRRMLMLQNALTTGYPHTAGLNPKAYRHVKYNERVLINPSKNIVDGDLLWHFNYLSVVERNELARRIGTNVEQILDDIMDVQRLTTHF